MHRSPLSALSRAPFRRPLGSAVPAAAMLALGAASLTLGALAADRPLPTRLPVRGASGQQAPVDTDGLASGPYSVMEMLYERTILRVNVLHLSMTFGAETSARLRELVAGRTHTTALAAEIVDVVIAAEDVLVRSQFLRNVGFDRMMEGIRENLGHALSAGILSAEEHDELLPQIDTMYAPLRPTGIRKGESIWYRVRGDSFHLAIQTLDGQLPVDQVSHGAVQRRALLGGYLAPDSDFRDGLVRSLFDAARP